MMEHNSEVYNHPYISFFIVHVYMEEDLCSGDCILHCYVPSSLPCFLTFCRSGIPTSCYIFNVFYYFSYTALTKDPQKILIDHTVVITVVH